jgi:hypothetical protein
MNDEIWNAIVVCLLAAGEKYAKSLPDRLNKSAGRFDASDYFAWLVQKETSRNEVLRDIFEDVSFLGNHFDFTIQIDGVKKTISFKVAKSSHIFQEMSKNGKKLNASGKLLLKNTMGGSDNDDNNEFSFFEDEFDMLLACQVQNRKGQKHAGVGLISSKAMVQRHVDGSGVELKRTKDQIQVKIENNSWDRLHIEEQYFSIEVLDEQEMKLRNEAYTKSKSDHFQNYYDLIFQGETLNGK